MTSTSGHDKNPLAEKLTLIREKINTLYVLADFVRDKDYLVAKNENSETITEMIKEVDELFALSVDLMPLVGNIRTRCKHRLIPFNVDANTLGYRCIDCDEPFEAYPASLVKQPDDIKSE